MSAPAKSAAGKAALQRREVVARILLGRGDALVVAGLGSSAYDLFAAGDTPHNFYLWGAMGGAAMVGLGIALAQPDRRVIVFTGDGEMLMGLGSFATIAGAGPANLAIVVLDNERYGETGMQATASARGADLAGIAAATGIVDTGTVRTAPELEALAQRIGTAPGPLVAVIKIGTDPTAVSLPPRDGPLLRSRFRLALLGAQEP